MAKVKKRIDQIPDRLKLTEKEQRDYLAKFKITVETLDNGTKFISFNCPYPDRQYTYIDVWFRTGAWNDPREKMGLAHFTEHAVFLGCPVAPTYHERITRPEQGGYRLGGNTTFPDTNYFLEASSNLTSPKKYGILYGLDHLLSTIAQPYIKNDSLANEKKVVIDEYQLLKTKLDYMNTRFIWNQILPADHPYLNFVTGTEATINAIDAKTIRNFLETAYVPQNAFLAIYSKGDPLKHAKVSRILKSKWLNGMKNRKGVLNPFPDYDWLIRHRGLSGQKKFCQVLPIKKGRAVVSLVKILELNPYSKEAFALDMALDIIDRVVFDSLRTKGYGYSPKLETDYIPFIGFGFCKTGIEIDSAKSDDLMTNFKMIFREAVKKAIKNEYHILEVKKKRFSVLDNPIPYAKRFREVFSGLYRFNQIIRPEDLNKIILSIKPQDVKVWLKDFAENPGALFAVGDILA